MRYLCILPLALALLCACGDKNPGFDASGVFEAHEVVVSAQVGGEIMQFHIDEGVAVSAADTVGNIDCEDLALQKAQVEASKDALKLKQVESSPEVLVLKQQISTQESQIGALQTRYAVVQKERDRVAGLVAKDAAPAKQLDDAQGELDVLQKQIATAQSQLTVLKQQISSAERTAAVRNRGIMSEETPLQSQIARIENQIGNCAIINPITGTVIAKYAEAHEIIGTGKPLYKVADLSDMTLRAYISGDQLTAVKLGQAVKVLVDDGKSAYKTYDGKISWISEKAEFTPKTIQTKNERANLVYAVKVDVKNDGYLRIGMYGELDF